MVVTPGTSGKLPTRRSWFRECAHVYPRLLCGQIYFRCTRHDELASTHTFVHGTSSAPHFQVTALDRSVLRLIFSSLNRLSPPAGDALATLEDYPVVTVVKETITGKWSGEGNQVCRLLRNVYCRYLSILRGSTAYISVACDIDLGMQRQLTP